MGRSLLIRLGASLALVTFLGHAVGTFMTVPPEQVAMHATIATMKATMIPMPVGAARSYMQILDGNNLGTAVLLLLCAVQLFGIAGAPSSPVTNRVLLITALGLAAFSIISAMHFFPVPTVFTAIASAFSLVARTRSSTGSHG